MSCTITNDIPLGIANQLREVFGSNDTIFQAHVNEFNTKEFKTYLKEKGHDMTDKGIVETLREYYNLKHPDINFTTILNPKDNPATKFGYTSVATREFGKRLAANMALDVYHQIVHIQGSSTKEKINAIRKKRGNKDYGVKDYFAEAISHKVQKEFVRVAKELGHSEEEILNAIKKKDTHTINKWFENATIQQKNVLALFKESKFNSNQERQVFMSEVFRDSRLGELRIDNERELTDNSTYESVDEAFDELDESLDDNDTSSNEDKDGSINNLNNKMGEYTTFMKHVDMSIRSYFNSLKRVRDRKIEGGYNYNTDNDFGIPDTMNAAQCIAIFYSMGDFTNRDTMIESAHAIADAVPGFESFHEFADYLSENTDFAFEVYRTFGKTIISKIETRVDDGKTETQISNRRSDKLTAITYEFYNAIRGTAISTNREYNLSQASEISKILANIKSAQEDIRDAEDQDDIDTINREIDEYVKNATARLATLLKYYFPTISEYSVSNFIKNNEIAGETNPYSNIDYLTKELVNLIKSTEETRNLYDERAKNISEAIRTNKSLTEAKNNGEHVDSSKYVDVTSLYATDYVSEKTKTATNIIASALVRFTPVRVEFNSRNVHGNQSSDIINNSMITNVIKTLQSQIALENYGKYKFQSRQYDFSNIMVEHRDENGKIINYGLFVEDGKGNFIPTSYAKRLLRARLFSGASDMISNENVLYAEMSKGDYIATSFINYFNPARDISLEEGSDSIPMANYFMRIPSDAPKNFVITAPRYSTSNLFLVTNRDEVNKLISDRLSKIPHLTQEQAYGEGILVSDLKHMQVVRDNQLLNHSLTEHPFDITIKSKKSLSDNKAKNGDEVYLTCKYSDDGLNTVYVLKGKLSEKDGKLKVTSPEFVGFSDDYDMPSEIQNKLKNHIETQLDKAGKIHRTINSKNAVYQQFRQAFVQEITDMATFINAIFQTNADGSIQTKNGEYLFKDGYANDAATARKLYAIYHVGKGKTIFETNNGIPKFTGKVFTSDRFELNGRNYGQEIIDKFFDFFSVTGEVGEHINFTVNDNGVQVTLTSKQEEALNNALNEFIQAYDKDAKRRMEQFKDFVPEKIYNDSNITEFALNHHLAFIGFNDLFEGNTKFYKGNQDFLKRAKEVQGSGVPYGINNYDEALNAPVTDIVSSLDFAGLKHIDENGNATDFNVRLRNRFRAVTIKNTVRTGETIGTFKKEKDKEGHAQFAKIGSLSKHLIEVLRNSGMTLKAAKQKAADMMSGYANTTVNDAQSYITFDEWIRRITARGQFPKYRKLIEAVLDESKPLDAATIGEFIQVQKNFYYDQHYNSELGVVAPRQIKNAEFVLVPRLIKGTQLEEVYNMMKEAEIDQLNTEETSKAGKCNVLTIWNNNGEITDKNRADFVANASGVAEEFNYNYLYTQQETPQHINAENKAGIQIMKKIVDNIPENSPLAPIKQKFFKLYSENIHASFQNIMKELNVALDENGNIKLDEQGNISGLKYDTFFKLLREEVARLGLDSNMVDYVTLASEQISDIAPITNMPTFLSSVNSKLESISQSLFNSRITRQKLPGFHAAQITNIGFKPVGEMVQNRTYSKELRYHPNGENYVEIMLPASNFGLERYKKDGTRKTDEELLKELQDSGIDTLIGYRIPTEGKQSVCIMKVVGFTDDTLGSTIVVPDDWVAQTGSDFDIDSVYGIQFTGKYDKEGNFSKYTYEEGGKEGLAQQAGRNNEILQCMIDILSSDEALEENLSRSNFDDIIDARDEAIDESVKRIRSQRSSYNFFDQADYQEDVMSGAKLKAFSVVRDTFCSICNTVRPYLSQDSQIAVRYYTEDGYTLKDLKKSFDNVREVSTGVFEVIHNTIGHTKNNKNSKGKILTAYSSQTTAHILDAVKEGAIPNVNDFTFQVYKTFPDIGSDYTIGIPFIMQNGVTRIVKAYNSSKSIYSFGSKNPIHTAIREVADELAKADNKFLPEQISIADVMTWLDENYAKELASVFNISDDFKIAFSNKEIQKLPIDGNRYRKELKSPSPVAKERLLFDLGVILQYHKLNTLAGTISSYARVCNPDKFGAKQSLFATNKVFDDILRLQQSHSKTPIITVKKDDKDISLVQSIYPGLFKGGRINIDALIQDTESVSSYPPLYNFLKYATATSIKVNRMLFPETQNKAFRNTVNSLIFAFSGERKIMSEEVYKDFQNYILNRLYNKTKAIKSSITYKVGEGFVYTDGDLETERRRIFGYGYSTNLNYTDVNGEEHEFTVSDINNPTQEEIDAFATMTPAQKAMWIQQNFRESGVFKYLNAVLFNEYKYRKTKVGQHELEFVEGTEDIETVYSEFEKCFYNSNPLVALATLDLVKYGFVVEGFKMKKNAVYKVIKNSALMDSDSSHRTGIIQDLVGMTHDLSLLDKDSLINDYVRSHSSMYQISSAKVKKIGKDKRVELPYGQDFIITLDLSNYDDKVKALKYNLLYATDDKEANEVAPNRYVKLRYDNRTILYRIHTDDYNNRLVAYPLNLLEATESGIWSANTSNNMYMSEDYYEDLANKILSVDDRERSTLDVDGETVIENRLSVDPVTGEIVETQIKHSRREQFKEQGLSSNTTSQLATIFGAKPEVKQGYRFHNDMTVKAGNRSIPFNINSTSSKDAGGFAYVRDKVQEHFGTNPLNVPLIIRSAALANYISSGSVIQTINGRQYEIRPYSLRSQNNKYIGERNKRKKIKERNPQVQAIMEAAQAAGMYGYRVNDAFEIRPVQPKTTVTPVVPNELYSSVVEFGVNSIKSMARRQVSEGDRKAGDAIRRLENKDIVAEAPSVELHLDDVIPTTAEYVHTTVDKILNDLEYFIQDSDGKWHNINDPETINLIRNNPAERKRFLKTILDARAFVKNYRLINELDIESEDESLRPMLRKIKDKINQLQNATIITKAEEAFALNYLSKISTNPLIQGDVISMLDGFHSAGAFDAWVNDLQETSSPLLQVITKEVMGDIRAKELKAKAVVSDFRKKVAEIEKKARAAGRSINWKHIIDEDGRFIQNYNQAFVDEINRLRNEIADAKDEFGEGSVEHLKAKLAYDEFKLANTNQPLVDEYYQKKINVTKFMLSTYPVIFSAYQKLAAQKRDILSYRDSNGKLEDSLQQKFDDIKKQMDNLTNIYTFDPASGTIVEKYGKGDPMSPFRGEKEDLLNIDAAYALQNYLKKMSEIYDEYFTQDAKYGFEEERNKHLDVINNYASLPMAERLKHEDYVKSRDWLNHNTRYQIDDDLKDLINNAFSALDETKSGRNNETKSGRNNEIKSGRKILSLTARNLDAYDNNGVIDATKFNEQQIEDIYEEEQIKYGIKESAPFSDRNLINCGPEQDTIFTSDFYKGMTSNGASNDDYIKKVNEINKVLKKYYDPSSQTIDTFDMEESDMRTLIALYDELEDIKKTKGATNGKAVRKFIKDHVEFTYNMEEYNRNKLLAEQKGGNYYRLWCKLNESLAEDENGNDIVVPNRYIYGYTMPKGYKTDGTGDNTYVDKKKTEALQTIHRYTSTERTQYYYQKFKEMQAKGKVEFDNWYRANHIYNPHTHTIEPLSCWTKLTINNVADDGTFLPGGEYVPAYNQLQSRPKDGKDKDGNVDGTPNYLNPEYKRKDSSTASNFKQTAAQQYHNNASMTDEEREMKELFESILRQNATTSAAKKFIDRGYMAMRAKNEEVDAKFLARQALNMIGWIEGNSGRESWYEHVSYERDRTIDMPMLSILKSKDSIEVPNNPPTQNQGESDADFKKRLEDYKKKQEEAKEHNAKIHRDMMDDNWIDVMSEFILKSAHFNAIQDNKYMLFYAKNMIDKLDVYVKNEGFNNLREDSETPSGYSTKKDTRLSEQYENWIRRLVYDQWKKPNNRLTRAANILQSLSSAKFMMLNVTSGIANVTVGEMQIFAEMLAKNHLGRDTYLKGKATWIESLPSFFRDMYSERATSLGSAIVKFFNVIDFDEINGIVSVPGIAEYFKRARDLTFSPSSMGEHLMQNGVMFSMLHSNRLIKNPNKDENGRTSYIYMTEAQYMNMAHNNALLEILNDEQRAQYAAFRKNELSTPDSTKEYAWFRRNLATEFANAFLSNKDKKKFIKKCREIQKKAKSEFNDDSKHPTLMSQLKLTDDGMLGFKDDSILATLGDEAYQILGRFKGTVISVNKEIHGVYDKLGGAQIESQWWGGIVTQYHKHIYPGIMKRYRRQGYYNEERGTIEKGCYVALKDFLALPLHKQSYMKKLKNETGASEAELDRIAGIQNILRNYVEFAIHIRTNWNMIPESERGNIKRALGDFAGVLGALCLAIGLHCIGDDDDDSLVYNLAMYEADRLASESFMYNPLGLYSEGKKLWSSPVAAQSTITDLLSTAGFISQYILQGDDFDPYYHGGLYAGENKLEVRLKRNIPIYHSINMLERLNRSNKYYKLGDNMLTIVPVKDIANWITD